MLVFKITDGNRQGHGGFQYPESGPVECTDWRRDEACGHGLHGWAKGEGEYHHHFSQGVFLVIDVKDEDVVTIEGNKCKFPGGNVVYSGTREGAVQYLIEKGALTKESNPTWATLPLDKMVTVAMRTADRAVRQHAPAALRAAGLEAEAAKLEALQPVMDVASASAAWSAAESAARSAASAAESARSAESAASAAESAAWSAARSAESAARSAESARSAASAAWSARSAESAAWSAAWSARSAESAAWSAEKEATRLDKLEMLGLVGSVRV